MPKPAVIATPLAFVAPGSIRRQPALGPAVPINTWSVLDVELNASCCSMLANWRSSRAGIDVSDDDHTVTLLIYPCVHRSRCYVPYCPKTATMILRKVGSRGRFPRQIKLCDEHGEVVVTRERARGLTIVDRC